MKIIIFWNKDNTVELVKKVQLALDELGLWDFMALEITDDPLVKKELNIEKEPALIVEEESIDFKDTIFEGIIPNDQEVRSMFISIIGGGDTSRKSCGTWWCGDCTSC